MRIYAPVSKKTATYDPAAVPTWLEIHLLIEMKNKAVGEHRRRFEKEIEEKEERRSSAVGCQGHFKPGQDRGTRCFACPGCKEWKKSGPGKEGNGFFHAVSLKEYYSLPTCSICGNRDHLYNDICATCPRPEHLVEEWCPCVECLNTRKVADSHKDCTCHVCDSVRMCNFHEKEENSWGPAGITCDWCYRHADGPLDRLKHRCP